MQEPDERVNGGAGQDVVHALAAFGVAGMAYRVFRRPVAEVAPERPATADPAGEFASADLPAASPPARMTALLPELHASLWAVPGPEPPPDMALDIAPPRRPTPPRRMAEHPQWAQVPAVAWRGLAERIAARTGQTLLPPPMRPAAEVLRLRWAPAEPAAVDPATQRDDGMFRRL